MKRVSPTRALQLLEETPLPQLGQMALEKKRELHPSKITTFVVDRNINYTNICWVKCKFCAFYREKGSPEGYLLSFEEIDKKIEELLEIGGTQILFQGGVHPDLKIDYYEKLVSHIHQKFPQITIHGFSAPEIDYIAKISRIPVEEVLIRLKGAGLSSIPGAGAEILVERVRKIISPKKISTDRWLEIHRKAHQLGIKSTATMMFGSVETPAEVIEHLERIRQLQDETGGFRAFIMWSFQPKNTQLYKEGVVNHKATSARYLRYLALARLYLDNFKNIQSSWVTQGSYIGQLALLYGANDLGSTMMEENVVRSAGVTNHLNQQEMINLIREVGEIPAKRNTAYEILEIYR
ncbi:MAG: dehypoxanthine futalosine cyclase [Epsilonproteobacteria bacterium]|nr:dehypoxanthine futalosine cyclase [Campylobacterota bacterium]NPA88892.1 dehypoxanthine futalosine cyclase [Campylobacterota bacterium]